MNILVTGGAGYIGSAVVERLDADARVAEIVVVDLLQFRSRVILWRERHLK